MTMNIKPLEWGKLWNMGLRSGVDAESVGRWATFIVERPNPACSYWIWSVVYDDNVSDRPDEKNYPTMDDAKAAANQWHAEQVRQWIVE
jgi:hypothetical protein